MPPSQRASKRPQVNKSPLVKKLDIKDVHKRIAVVVCYEKGTKTTDVSEATDVPLRQTQRVLKRWKDEGSWEDRPRSGRLKTATTPEKMGARWLQHPLKSHAHSFRCRPRSAETRSARCG